MDDSSSLHADLAMVASELEEVDARRQVAYESQQRLSAHRDRFAKQLEALLGQPDGERTHRIGSDASDVRDIAEATEGLEMVDRQLAVLAGELRRLDARRVGLEAHSQALIAMVATSSAFGPETTSNSGRDVARPADGGNWLAVVPRTQAILHVLQTADVPLGVQEIVEQLQAAGRTDEYGAVMSTLQLLKDTARVNRIDRGRYVPA